MTTRHRAIPPSQARKHPTPDGPGWWIVRELSCKNKGKRRAPIRESKLAELIGCDEDYAARLLTEAEGMGWMQRTDAGWQGRI